MLKFGCKAQLMAWLLDMMIQEDLGSLHNHFEEEMKQQKEENTWTFSESKKDNWQNHHLLCDLTLGKIFTSCLWNSSKIRQNGTTTKKT